VLPLVGPIWWEECPALPAKRAAQNILLYSEISIQQHGWMRYIHRYFESPLWLQFLSKLTWFYSLHLHQQWLWQVSAFVAETIGATNVRNSPEVDHNPAPSTWQATPIVADSTDFPRPANLPVGTPHYIGGHVWLFTYCLSQTWGIYSYDQQSTLILFIPWCWKQRKYPKISRMLRIYAAALPKLFAVQNLKSWYRIRID
jgi:hypothetical protein